MLPSLTAEKLVPDRSLIYLIGCSGGLDSVVLAHHYLELWKSGQLDHSPVLFHLDHELRESSSADARFVESLALQWDLPLLIDHVSVEKFSQRSGLNLEEAGRLARYRRMLRIGRDLGHGCLAVIAHHGDDYGEGIFLKIIRGATDRSFFMPVFREFQVSRKETLTLFRPFLGNSRSDLESYAARHGLSWCEDPTNASDTFRRNRLRHHLIPIMKEEGWDPAALWRRLHGFNDRFGQTHATESVGHLYMPVNLLEGATASEVKHLMDRILTRLYLPPLQGNAGSGLLAEIMRQSRNGHIVIQTKDWQMWSSSRLIWVFRSDAEILKRPMTSVEGNELIVTTARRSFRYRLSDGQGYSFFEPGLRTKTGSKVKEIFQREDVPAPLRTVLPLVISNGHVDQICGAVAGLKNISFEE